MGKSEGKRSGKSKMGRQKIEIKKITNEEARQVCFSKRRHGLIKKAGELCILCGAEIAIIVFSPAGKAFSYGDPSVDTVIKRFLDPNSHVPAPPDAHRVSNVQELNSQHEKLVQEIEVHRKRRLELQKQQRNEERGQIGRFWDADVDSLSPEQLVEFKGALEEMRSALAKRTDELIMGMAMMHPPTTVDHHHHRQFLLPPLAPPPYASTSSIAPLPCNSFLTGYNTNPMTIPFTNNINASMGASSRLETMPNSGDYFLNNQFTGRPFYRL